MAFDTKIPLTWFSFMFTFMEMMFFRIIFLAPMTLQTEIVAFPVEFQAVYVMTVAADNPLHIHLALGKRSIDIHLLKNLAIGVIEAILKERWYHLVEQIARPVIVISKLKAPGMTGRAGFI